MLLEVPRDRVVRLFFARYAFLFRTTVLACGAINGILQTLRQGIGPYD